mmetsp:Transcript_55972/g.148008  ORF Transcript_55972/g.148008 Transcript_55972/m.148008 type:complete len:121 (-) Transcript_55972:384-746(-)
MSSEYVKMQRPAKRSANSGVVTGSKPEKSAVVGGHVDSESSCHEDPPSTRAEAPRGHNASELRRQPTVDLANEELPDWDGPTPTWQEADPFHWGIPPNPKPKSSRARANMPSDAADYSEA